MSPTSSPSLLLRNARVILPERVLDRASVLIESGKVAKITSVDSTSTASSDLIDLDGFVLSPGFIDVHIHGAAGIDTMEASAQQLVELARFLATQGVTGWLPTFVPASDDNYATSINAIVQAMQMDGEGARILGVHYEGPFVNLAQCGALHREHFKTYATPADLDGFPTPGADKVRMITLAPEISGGVELIRELKARGWVISIGHTRAELEILDQAFAAGARHMTHFMNAMSPLHHRKPGPIAWGLSRDDVTFDMIADGMHLDPFMLQLLLKTKGSRGISLISDAIAAAGKGDGDYQIWGETISVANGRTSNSSGSIAGSVITMLDAVRMMRLLGVADVEIARMASTNPARLLGLDYECGSIEEGKRADMVALDNDGKVRLTIVGGSVVFQA
jgi:N-acetylglucosamine-6-phosphate deacetylase